MAKLKLSEETIKEIENKANSKAKNLAIEAREKMTSEYLSIIKQFYSEYEPEYYYRHFNNDYSDSGLMNSGLGHTFQKYYKNKKKYNNTRFSGGIWISANFMFTDYKGTPEQVLKTFMLGFHGPVDMGSSSGEGLKEPISGTPYFGIYKGLNKGYMDVYEHMVRFRYDLIQDFKKRLTIK